MPVSESTASKPNFPQLTSLRFFLALWVVLFHQAYADGYLPPTVPGLTDWAYTVLQAGYLAVSVFFVLSGFVLSCNYPLNIRWPYLSKRTLQFAIGRFARIYPAYLVGLVLVVPHIWQSLAPDHRLSRLANEALLAIPHWTLLQAWIPSLALSWNPPGWSLSAEAFFYACFPLLGVAIWRLSSIRSLAIACVSTWLAALAAPLVIQLTAEEAFRVDPARLNPASFWTTLAFYSPLLRLPEFAAGIVLGKLYLELGRRGSTLLNHGFWLYLPAILIEAAVILASDSLPSAIFENALLLPIHAAIILGFALGGGPLLSLLSKRVFVFLGNASYAIYILHLPVLMWMKLAVAPGTDGLGIMALYVATVVGFSMLLYLWVEVPANRYLKQRLTPPSTARND